MIEVLTNPVFIILMVLGYLIGNILLLKHTAFLGMKKVNKNKQKEKNHKVK